MHVTPSVGMLAEFQRTVKGEQFKLLCFGLLLPFRLLVHMPVIMCGLIEALVR